MAHHPDPLWDVVAVLGIRENGKCQGVAKKTHGGPCGWHLEGDALDAMARLEDDLSLRNPNSSVLRRHLLRLADHGLCHHHRNWQREEIVDRWCQNIDDYVEDLEDPIAPVYGRGSPPPPPPPGRSAQVDTLQVELTQMSIGEGRGPSRTVTHASRAASELPGSDVVSPISSPATMRSYASTPAREYSTPSTPRSSNVKPVFYPKIEEVVETSEPRRYGVVLSPLSVIVMLRIVHRNPTRGARPSPAKPSRFSLSRIWK
jgi:hypothetical protein